MFRLRHTDVTSSKLIFDDCVDGVYGVIGEFVPEPEPPEPTYDELRRVEYDKLNQDEMRYDDLINGTSTWQDAIEAIKLQYPKI